MDSVVDREVLADRLVEMLKEEDVLQEAAETIVGSSLGPVEAADYLLKLHSDVFDSNG